MKCGLLWYDGDPRRGLEEKIGLAAQRYRAKFGRSPDLCYVHPKAAGADLNHGAIVPLDGRSTIRVLPARTVLLHHLWLGESDASSAAIPPNG